MRERRWVFSEDKAVALNGYFNEKDDASMEALPAVVVLPGGGYLGISEPEGAPVARWFAENGFRAFVLEYTTAYGEFGKTGDMNPNVLFPGPAYDLASALMTIRENAKEWNIEPERIALCGFSAGGHLVSYFANNWVKLAAECGVEARVLRPNASILCYGATDLTRDPETFMEKQMYTAVFGTDNPAEEERVALSARFNVNINTPPTFLWHSAADTAVPATDSISLAAALAREHVHYALHVFDKGAHADGLSEGMPAQIWPQLAVRFLGRYMR